MVSKLPPKLHVTLLKASRVKGKQQSSFRKALQAAAPSIEYRPRLAPLHTVAFSSLH